MIADPPSDVGSVHVSATACDDGVAVSESGTEGTVAGAGAGVGAGSNDAEYANLFGEPTPAFVTTLGVAALMIAAVTAAGVADVRVSK